MYAKNFLLIFYNLECDIPDCYVCVQDVLCYIVFYPACTGRWPDVGSVLARRLRCRPNIYPTLCRRLVFAGYEYKCIILLLLLSLFILLLLLFIHIQLLFFF